MPNEENVLIDQTVNSKKENFDAANYNVPNVPIIHKHCFPNMRKIDMVTLLYLPHQFLNLMKVYVPLICDRGKPMQNHGK